jgi:hypothetical protein
MYFCHLTTETDMQKQTRGAFNLDGFCIWAGIGRSQAYEEAKKGRLRLTKCGRKTLVALDDAEAWLASLPKFGGEVAE